MDGLPSRAMTRRDKRATPGDSVIPPQRLSEYLSGIGLPLTGFVGNRWNAVEGSLRAAENPGKVARGPVN